MKVLEQVEIIHGRGFVHEDLLPRNVVFSGDDGWVFDFDLMREEKQPYVAGYNHEAFSPFRHAEARASLSMSKQHDIWALVEMSKAYFGLQEGLPKDDLTALIAFFKTGVITG